VLRLPDGTTEPDQVAAEEPLEIRIGGRPVAVTMRTPGHDEELALGFCLSEGLKPVAAALPDDLVANTVDVEAPSFDPERLRRSFYTSSSCGVCGKGALESVAVEAAHVDNRLTLPAELLAGLPDRLRAAQPAFAATGGLHATGLFDSTGELLCLREDVGRHNAMDKVVGWAFLEGRLPLNDAVLCLSGRLSFELVQKAAVAACPIVVAVGAPSSLAVELAGRPRAHALRLRPRRPAERLHRAVARPRLTGLLLVGGASTRFGSPKALARLDGETLAARAWRTLGEACDERLAVGKRADGLALPFELVDDGTETRAALAGIVAGLRAASHDRVVVLPVDTPLVTPELLRALGDVGAEAAVTQTGPLPATFARSALPALERRLAAGRLTLREALDELDTRRVKVDETLLANVNTPDELRRLG
jgi:FdhD protein